jgi:ribose-phosphate pyrophosphokinase
MLIKKYPDGGSYVINDQNEVHLIYRINSYEDLFLLKSIKDANPNLKEITIPCMFQQQHDRRFNQNESFELKLVCDFINSCGFEKVKVFHPHSDVTQALLNNCEVIDNTEFITKVLLKIKSLDNLILMSSDAGGFKPLIKLATHLEWDETFSASKSRDSKTHKLTQLIDRQDFEGKDVLIVDDICVYGGTFIGLAKMLKERNVGKLYLAISHITVEKPNQELWYHFDKVFTTNSKGIEYFDYNDFPPKYLEITNLF